MIVTDWPDEILRIVDVSWFLDGRSVSSGRGLDGREQIVTRENRVWTGAITLSPLWGSMMQRHRAYVHSLRGRARVFRLPVHNLYTTLYDGDPVAFWRSLGVSEEDILAGSLPFDDGARFDGGAGFALPSYEAPELAAPAAAGDTRVEVIGAVGLLLEVGAFFSINDFLYEVEANDNGAITFNPPLREAAAAGTEIEVNRPMIRVRMASDGEGRALERYGKYGEAVTISVVEAFDR